MTQDQYIIQRKVSLIELGKTLKNISQACRQLRVSRQHYYDVKQVLREEGVEGLAKRPRVTSRPYNRTGEAVEARILAYSLDFPSHGHQRVANELKREGIGISSGGVRCVWLRHGLTTRADRLRRLEEWSAANGGVLTAAQVAAIESTRAKREAHGEIETHHPGFLVGQDTYYVGYIKGVGKIYQQTGIDTFSAVGFAKLYTDKTAIAAADFLNDKVLPYFDAEGLRVLRTLTDRGSEYCGREGEHAYQLYLELNDVEHSRTKPYSPQTNGITEKLNQTIQTEFYAVTFRKKYYQSLDELQRDLDAFMAYYNNERTHQGRHCKGRTPRETFLDGIALYKNLVQDQTNLH